jgi:hypothetical protein
VTTPAAVPFADPAMEPPAPDRLPAAAWALAWASVLTQALTVADRGLRSDEGWAVVISMLIGALVIWWFAAGVLSARTGRLVVTWLLLVIVFVAEAATVVDEALRGQVGMPALHLVSTMAMIGSLMWFSTTPYYFWQRTRPRVSGPSRSGVLAVAVLVGLSAGLVETDDQAPLHVQMNG